MVDLQHKSKEFLNGYARANPLIGARAKVPLLHVLVDNDNDDDDDDNDVFLCESMIVAEYIAEKHNVLLPVSLEDRAIMRLFTELCGSSFAYFPILRAKGDQFKVAVETFREGLVKVNSFLKHQQQQQQRNGNHDNNDEGPFLLGATFSLAECNAAPFVQRAITILPILTGQANFPPVKKVDPLEICDELGLVQLKRWMEAILARPSVMATSVPREDLLKGTTRMLELFSTMEQN